MSDLDAIARRIRRRVVQMAHDAKAAHVASALSCTDATVAFYHAAGQVNPLDPKDPDRDRFVLSKGHGCMALYAVLADLGFFPAALLDGFCKAGGMLTEHPPYGLPGIEAATGSLGHGLSIATGAALAGRLLGESYKTVALLGDGECSEGSVWEAAAFAADQRLDSLTVIIDANGLRGTDSTPDNSATLKRKWRAFGWRAVGVDGHNIRAIATAIGSAHAGSPLAIIATTIKGYPISFMRGNQLWHYRAPDEHELELALAELRDQWENPL